MGGGDGGRGWGRRGERWGEVARAVSRGMAGWPKTIGELDVEG